MDTLDKYLIRELLVYFLMVLLGISALGVGIDFLSKFWSTGTPFLQAIEIYLYKLPKFVQQFVPVAALMATLLVVSSMARQNEVLALYASGISNIRIISTFVSVVATLSTVAFLFFDPLLPLFESKRAQLEVPDAAQKMADETAQENRFGFWYRSQNLIYRVGAFYAATKTLQDIELYLLSPDFQVQKKILAQKAIFQDSDWLIQDGLEITYPTPHSFPEGREFAELRNIIPEKPADYANVKVEETTMRLRDLRKYIERSQKYGVDTTLQKVSYHERVSHVFSPLIFVLLGLAFSLNALKHQSAAKGVAFSFLLVFAYLIMSKMTLSLGRGGRIPPLVAAWLPNVLFLFTAGFKLTKTKNA